MLGTALSLIILGLFVLALVALYVWTRRTESATAFEQAPGVKTEAQGDALRLGIALNQSGSQLGGH